MINIVGEYELDINIQNMFNTYNLIIKNHNLVTEKGLEFILKCITNQTTERLGNIIVGYNQQDPSLSDTYDTFTNPQDLQNDPPVVEENVLIYKATIDGSVLHNTTEIGILGTKNTLITRDVHDRYDIPYNALITLQYTLTLSNIENEEIEEEETLND